MTELWQWRHGYFQSELYDSEDVALFWADRATTGAHDDGIAVRSLMASDWHRRNVDGWMDPEPEPEPKPDLAEAMLAWADQMEAESSTIGHILAIEVRNRVNNFKEGK